MSNRVLYSFIFAFLTALTVNAAHEVVEHERSVCEVCIHSQANDDFDVDVTVPGDFPTMGHQLNTSLLSLILSNNLILKESIRAPPFTV